MTFIATKQPVLNRGVAPDGFLTELVEWARTADDAVFAPNPASDVYSAVRQALGPWRGLQHRRAVMCEALRVLAGFESSWNWTEGVDTTNAASMANVDGQETGIFQVSYDSLKLDRSAGLSAFVAARKASRVQDFIRIMKEDHAFALGYCARLLRVSISWDGPIKRGKIQPWLRRDAVAEFESLLT